MGADHEGLAADAEQLALQCVLELRFGEGHGEGLVQGTGQQLPVAQAVGGAVLQAVGYPEVVDAGGALGLAQVGAHFAGAPGVLDPESADPRVLAGQGETRRRLGVGEEGAVDVQPDPALPAPVQPAREMLRAHLVPLHRAAAEVPVDHVQRKPVAARQQRIQLR